MSPKSKKDKKEKIKDTDKTKEVATRKKEKYFYGTGRRKTAVARVRLYKGKGEVEINEKEGKHYLKHPSLLDLIKAPLVLTGNASKFNILVKVSGGGFKSQAEAIRHGASRALLTDDSGLKITLKKAGYLTRDSRKKERKKAGLKRARKAPQFTKR